MSKLDHTIRLALATALFAGLSFPRDAVAQGKGHDKGRHEGKEAKADKKDHHDRDEKGRLIRSDAGTVVQPVVVTRKVKSVPPGLATRRVTAPEAVIVTRDVLVANGFQVVQVVPSGTSQVIYYRRGNNGVGRGLGPVQKIIVVPAGETVRFQSVPQSLLGTILARLR
jgi:hypothetical protein